MIAGRHDLLGYTNVDVGSPPDWHRDPVHDRRAPLLFWNAVPYLDPACGDHKITWEFNRHQHCLVLGRAFHLTGDERYYREFVGQLTSWIAANPPLQGTNWTSMLELALRSVSWLWALHFFARAAGEATTTVACRSLLALDRQLVHVEHNLSRYFSPNTHLSGEPSRSTSWDARSRSWGTRGLVPWRGGRSWSMKQPARSIRMAGMQSSRPITTATPPTSTCWRSMSRARPATRPRQLSKPRPADRPRTENHGY